VTDMAGMFNSCHNFQGRGLELWQTKSLTAMNYMFYSCYSLSVDLSGFDVSNVAQMEFMFYLASGFNSDLSLWRVVNVNDLSSAFAEAKSFDQDLCAWGELLPSEVRIDQVFAGSGCDNTTDPVTLSDGPWCRLCS